MTLEFLFLLRNGDSVRWVDPDNGECTETFRISSIKFRGNLICISDDSGSYLECYKEELEEPHYY